MRSVADRASGAASGSICHTSRSLHDHATIDEVVEQFVDQQWCPAGASGDQLVDPGRDVAAETSADDGVDRRAIEPTETDDRGPRCPTQPGDQLTELRSPFRLFGSRRHHDEQRRVGEVETQVLQDLDAGLVGPMQVVERQHHGLIGTDPGDQRGERVLCSHLERLGGTDRWLQIEPFDQRSERRQPGGQPGDVVLRSRPQMAADRGDQRLVGHRRRQLPRACVQHVVATRSRRLRAAKRRACSCPCHPHPPPRRREPSPRLLAARRASNRSRSLSRPDRRVGQCVPSHPYVPTEYVQGTDARSADAWLSVDHDSRIAGPSGLTPIAGTPHPRGRPDRRRARGSPQRAAGGVAAVAAVHRRRAGRPRPPCPTGRRADAARAGRRRRGRRGRRRMDAAGSPGRLGRARGLRRAHLQLHRDRGADSLPTASTGTSTSCP